MNPIYIDEIFYGLQGEGDRMGYPSIFIRTGGCNLTCEGFGCSMESQKKPGFFVKGCDTIHAVNAEHFKHTWTPYEYFKDLTADVTVKIPATLAYNEDRVDIIFTGGEPLLWYKNPVMVDAVRYFISRGHKVWFETNGTIPVDFDKFPIYKQCSFSISVKMSASGEPKRKRWKPRHVDNYLLNTKGSYFKFVLSNKSLKEEADEIFEYLDQIPTYATVFCMPLGEIETEVSENAQAVYEFALVNGFKYSDRLHIRIYGKLRGV